MPDAPMFYLAWVFRNKAGTGKIVAGRQVQENTGHWQNWKLGQTVRCTCKTEYVSYMKKMGGSRWRIWLRYSSTSRKAVGLILDVVFEVGRLSL
jgi:hypothetical protein